MQIDAIVEVDELDEVAAAEVVGVHLGRRQRTTSSISSSSLLVLRRFHDWA